GRAASSSSASSRGRTASISPSAHVRRGKRDSMLGHSPSIRSQFPQVPTRWEPRKSLVGEEFKSIFVSGSQFPHRGLRRPPPSRDTTRLRGGSQFSKNTGKTAGSTPLGSSRGVPDPWGVDGVFFVGTWEPAAGRVATSQKHREKARSVRQPGS